MSKQQASEGQTQEPVGGMKWVKATERLPHNEWGKFCKIGAMMGLCFYRKSENIWTDETGVKYKSEHITWLDENYAPPPAPIKTEGEDEKVKKIKKWIEERMALFPDDPNLSERGAYDAYLNVLNFINSKTTPPPSPVGIDVEALAKEYAKPVIVSDEFTYPQSALTKIKEVAFKAGYAASLPQSSTSEEEKEIKEDRIYSKEELRDMAERFGGFEIP